MFSKWKLNEKIFLNFDAVLFPNFPLLVPVLTWMCTCHVEGRQIFTRTLAGSSVVFTSVCVGVLPDMRPTSSMSSQPEKASLTLRIRATVDCLLFLVIWRDGAQETHTECKKKKSAIVFFQQLYKKLWWLLMKPVCVYTPPVNSWKTCFHYQD